MSFGGFPLAQMFGNQGGPTGFSPQSAAIGANAGMPVSGIPQPAPGMPQGNMSPLLKQMMMSHMMNAGGQMGQPSASPVGAVSSAIQPAMNAFMMNRMGMLGK